MLIKPILTGYYKSDTICILTCKKRGFLPMYSGGQERRIYKRYEKLPTEDPIMAGFQIRSDEAQEIESDDW